MEILVARKLVEALHTETLHLVASAMGGCLGLSHSRNDLGKDTAQDGFTFGVRRVWRDGNSLDGMADNLQKVGFGRWEWGTMLTFPSRSLIAVISILSTLIIWLSRPMTVIRTVTMEPSFNFFSSYSRL